ncbi:cell surface protein SprA [Galbibacter pacificus]|uniref:Cell surface protein SprA n=1 Tax=Galbibacter pacificus TaxID=2996052 RepID=A0ABT6FSS6_9FLAO|nr:cell surface protein SprA [Galbibacter pacificus]MDG3582581.1 cell surface protein SprA [Galbibacter pacificus]MDG3586300.1 cell surface protein SprA [Galbibacter pacificus]
MKTTTCPKLMNKRLKAILLLCSLLISITAFSQEESERQQDSTQSGVALGKIKLQDPESISSKYTYDPVTDKYIFTETIGDYDISYPVILTPEEYEKLVLKEQMKDYFKEKIDAVSGKEGTEEAQKNLLPSFYVNSNFFESIFGGNTIEVIPQGSVAMDLGVRFQKNDNPALSPRNRSNISFDFDQRISLSLLGKVGTRLSINANYDTEATFDFQNLIKLEYTPNEDDIIQKIEVGNVSMPLNSTLINGAQSLFGVKTELKFGKTTVTGVFSEQRSQSRSVTAQGDGTVNEFEILALDYDEDRHFFLSQFFRDQYDQALESYPFIRSQVQITRIEVWVTNRAQRTDNVRNVVALQDLGEPTPENTRINQNAPPGFFGTVNNLPRNGANAYDPFNIGGAGSALTQSIRDIATVQQGFNVPGYNPSQGFDYSILENARKLESGREYQLDTQLGYISLNQRLSNDEVLAVAFQYTYQGQVYQVGEFANDGVNATEFEENNGVVTQVNPQALVLKMLKSNITNVSDPVWDLMMKNIYSTGAFQLSQEDFRLNILYTDPSPINYITPVDEATWPQGLEERILLDVFNFDRLNVYNDPQSGGDGFFDFLPGITVDTQNGLIKFTKVEPFGEYLYDVLGDDSNYDAPNYTPNNDNQAKYVYRNMYKLTKAASLENAEKNKFVLKGRYKAQSSGGIPLGAFNVPRGSVRVTAGGRVLQEGIDYTVNYQAGTVQILDESLRASNTPIEVSVENNAVFGQQTRRFSGVHVEHQFNENFMLGGTFLNMSERPLTQKANFGVEPVNNTILGINGNYSKEIPFFTRLVNKLPSIDTDVASNLSIRGDFAYLIPGSPKSSDFDGETTSYLDDFEGAQAFIDIRSSLAWTLASAPIGYGGEIENDNVASRGKRAKMAWYTIDPIFYSNQRPGGVTEDDISTNQTRRIFIDEIFPQQDVAQGQTLVQPTLDIAYYPEEKGPYNDNGSFESLADQDRWGGIMRSVSSTNFEQSNVEFIQFWMLDPYYQDGPLPGQGGDLVFNLGNINEDILKDGRKQYENGLPLDSNPALVNTTEFGKVPSTQSLVYAFDANTSNRNTQDAGFDGLLDAEEASFYNNPGPDPALDNYQFYLEATGSILNRYYNYNNPQGNSPVQVGNTNRGSTTLPDVEDIDRDLTMNTVDSYFQYRIPIHPNIQRTDTYVTDIREVDVETPNNDSYRVRWIQFKVPIDEYEEAIGGITDIRSVSFMRMFLTGFSNPVVLRFGTLDLVRGDWRNYSSSLQPEDDPDPNDDGTFVDVNTVNIQENEQREPIPYRLPPGVVREQLNNNNTIIRQNEQSLSFAVCDLETEDSRGVFKNINIDVRQYKRIKMFVHAEQYETTPVSDGDLVAFLRLGTDFTENYYQVEVPLQITPPGTTDPETIWPDINNIDLPLSLLSKIKAQGINDGTLQDVTYYDGDGNVIDEFAPRELGQMRVAVKGNPSLGNIRAAMVGVKNPSTVVGDNVCGEVWFNELRLAELDNNGGWAAVAAMDLNLADFANISATGNMSTSGFGNIDQTPNERSREDVRGYALNTNVNLGQLLPKQWGIQLPMNYSVSEELITPEFDPLYQDIKLEDRLDAAETPEQEDRIRNQSEDYTKRKSINFIGVRKNRGAEQKPKVYDIENFTLNFAYNQVEHRDFEVENFKDQNVRTGFLYNHNFQPVEVIPLKNADSVLKSKYWNWLKEFNFNLLPTSVSINSNYTRTFNRQSFRQVFEAGDTSDFLSLPEVQQRNYMFDWQYAVNYNLTKSLQFNFTASNNSIIKNYFDVDENGDEVVNPDLALWNDFWNVGDPNRHAQQLQINYDIPFDKIPFLSFLSGTYAYTGDFDWQRGSDVLNDIAGENLNTIQNANTHNLNGALTMDKLYSYIGLTRKSGNGGEQSSRGALPIADPDGKPQEEDKKDKKYGAYNTFIDLATMVKRINVSYSSNSGKVLPGYTESIGFLGTLRPSWGFVFGSQADVRFAAAQKGWLTTFPEFNQQYMSREATQLNVSASLQPFKDLTIDLVADRQYSESYAENYKIEDINADGVLDYNALIQNQYGDFSISTIMIGTAFDAAKEASSETFDKFSENRIIVAQRLAGEAENPNAAEYPEGYGPTNQAVLLPAFYAAYTGQSASSVSLKAFRDTPLPNWTAKYTGLMRLQWFKDNFRRFSLGHGYRSSYSINSFRSNLDYGQGSQFDQAGNYKNEILYTNVTLVEQFNPLLRVDFEMNNSVSILAEMRKDRALSLSFDNNLLTEMSGKEYVVGLGYRIPDLRFVTNIGGRRTVLKGDLNLKADLSLRDNITVIRNLDINTNQVTAGQNIWALKFTADYALTKNLTTLFFYDHTFSEFKVSTAFPQTTIRTGFTLRYNFGN